MPGNTPREDHILALWDQGQSIEQIAREVGINRRKVAQLIGTYCDCGETMRAHNAMIAASTGLLAAITRARAAA